MGKRAATRSLAKGAPRRYRSQNGVRAAPHAGHFDAGLWELAQRTAASSAELIQLEGPFVAECWLSDLASIWENVELIDDDAEKVIGLSVVDAAAAEESPRALTLLTGLAAVGGPHVAPRARTESRRLAAALSDKAPTWLGALGRARFVGSWRTQEPFGDGDMVVLVLEHDGDPPHAVGVLIDHNLGSMAKDVLVADDAVMLRSTWESAVPGVTTRDMSAQEAADVLAHGLAVEDMYLDSPATDDLRSFRPLLRTYLKALPRPRPIERPTLDERDRDRLAEEFAASDEARGLAHAVVDDIAWRIIDFGCDYSDGDPLRWSPVVVEMFMTDWLPRKALLEVPVKAAPDAIEAWVRFSGRRRGLAQELIEEAAAAVGLWTSEYVEAMRDSARFGPAKAIVGAALAEGIELSDQAAVKAWISDFNAKPEAERRKTLP